MQPIEFPKTVQGMILPYLELFCLRTQSTEAHFGISAVNDHRFMSRLRAGKVTLATINRALEFARQQGAGR